MQSKRKTLEKKALDFKEKSRERREEKFQKKNPGQIVKTREKEVGYVSAKLYLGNDEIADGAINYNSNTHTVKWTANQDFLDNMPLKGETYTLKVTVLPI